MQTKEWTKIAHNPQLDVELLHAYYIQHAYPRHSHDYYVISLIARGRQSFTHQGTKHRTPPGGLILINPGAVHTGEAADAQGFELRSLYPSPSLMETAVFELSGRRALPYFKDVRVDHPWATNSILSLHKAILEGAGMLECESRILWTMAQLIKRYANVGFNERQLGKEKKAIQRNISSASVAVLHGYKNTLKYQAGLAAGIFLLMLLSGLLSTTPLRLFPTFEPIMRYVGAALAMVSFCATSTWALFGTAIKTYLHDPRLKTVINILLCLSLVYTAISLTGII